MQLDVQNEEVKNLITFYAIALEADYKFLKQIMYIVKNLA
jgi:hypothetical protein